jgi:D-beta-D-heptose 7-phosphate kinase/D-beta-D-heptose 1-phosphate adenosyltransferase
MSGPEIPFPPISRARTDDLLHRFSGLSIVIVGDVMLDHFVFGRVSRISPEAPVPVVEFDREEFRVGGAGNVAHNLGQLGASVEVLGVIGGDEHGTRLKEALRADGIGTSGVLVEEGRPTTRKMRVVTNRNQQVARIDYESDREISSQTEAALVASLQRCSESARAIIISDYLKGSVTRTLAARAIGVGRDRRVPVLVDPKIPHLDYYIGATLLTPNNLEAEAATQMRIRSHHDARAAARAIRDRLSCEGVLITRGEAGMWLLNHDREGSLPAATREVADVMGAGDTVVATLALALAAGADTLEAAWLANAAAGISVSKFGPAGVTPAELRASINGL